MKPGRSLFSEIESLRDDHVPRIVGLLESGESPGRVALRVDGHPTDLVAALARASLGRDGSEGLPLSRGKPTRPGLASALTESAWSTVLNGDVPSRLALSAGLLQLFDFWDGSHEAAQQADDLGEKATSTYWHLIAHRREPDPGNALYWARRVGRHPTSAAIVERARPLLEAHGDKGLTAKLVDDGWNHAAMITLCTQARPGTPTDSLARRLQRVEMIAVLEASLGACFPVV